MKKLLALSLVAALVGLVGCGKPKTTMPGTNKPGESKPAVVPPADTNKGKDPPPAEGGSVSMENVPVEVEKEKEGKVKIAIKRDKYDGEVTVTFESKAKDVTIDPAEVKLAGDKSDAEVTVKAGKDAAEGDIIVSVKPKDEKVKPVEGKITVKVK